MRTIERTTKFKRDFKRELKSRHRATIDRDLIAVLQCIAFDKPLDERYRDHALAGSWAGHRDCHIRPDLVLIYEKPDDGTLRLARLGSHSELGL
jgi:mRNA interferase YafQ